MRCACTCQRLWRPVVSVLNTTRNVGDCSCRFPNIMFTPSVDSRAYTTVPNNQDHQVVFDSIMCLSVTLCLLCHNLLWCGEVLSMCWIHVQSTRVNFLNEAAKANIPHSGHTKMIVITRTKMYFVWWLFLVSMLSSSYEAISSHESALLDSDLFRNGYWTMSQNSFCLQMTNTLANMLSVRACVCVCANGISIHCLFLNNVIDMNKRHG